MTDCKFANYTGSATTTPESDTSIKTVVMTPVIPDVNLDKVIAALNANVKKNIYKDKTEHKTLYKKGDAKPEEQSLGFCAHYVGTALAAGGGTLNGNQNPNEKDRPEAAKNWGCLLKRNGFKELTTKINLDPNFNEPDYTPTKGDAVVIQDYSGDPNTYGHIAIYDGTQWVSDFKQNVHHATTHPPVSKSQALEDSFYPGGGYRHAKPQPSYVIYRKSDWK
ncbi:MAG: CHAP domain-containing protein [Sulfuriferula sp.]|nr:CHAP domain-containing protein [Sulfuriferula sp.]